MRISQWLIANCQKSPERKAWLGRLPYLLGDLDLRWSLRLGEALDHPGVASWVAPVTRADGEPAMLKLPMPSWRGGVLRSQREPWLMIGPKPFVGDQSYDPTQHLMNCETRLHRDPDELVRRVADLAEVDAEHLRLWTFARAAAEPRDDWQDDRWMKMARKLAL